MVNVIESIELCKLVGHRDNPNRMSRSDFSKLVRNIKKSGLYEPLVVRRHPNGCGCYEIINGYHRSKALVELGFMAADCVVWDISDEEADMFLVTLNRLCGKDDLDRKLVILKRLNARVEAGELSKLLPQTKKQIERLMNMKMPAGPANVDMKSFASPLVFFLDDGQRELVERALSLAEKKCEVKRKAVSRAAGLVRIGECYIGALEQGDK